MIRRCLAALTLGASTYAGALGAALVLEGCGSGSGSTSGRRVVLHTRVDVEPSAAAGFTTAAGWRVTLSRVLLAAGPFYYFDGAPPLARHDAWLGIRAAHAHPQHYAYGNAMGEMLEASSVDLLAGPSDFPDGSGVTGTYRSARFSFTVPPLGPRAEALAGHAVVAEGQAEKDGQTTRWFRAVADRADLDRNIVEGRVDGCEFQETLVEGDGTVTLLINPKPWFDLVDFSAVEPGSADAPLEFPAASQPRIAFGQGVSALTAYKFAFSPDRIERK